MVYQHSSMGLSCRDVARNLKVDPSTVSRIVSRFEATGNVDPTPRSGAPNKLSDYDEFVLIEILLEQPSKYLHELQQEIENSTGTQIDMSTICRFLKRNNFSRKRLNHVALQRNAFLREQFMSDMSIYDPDMLLFIDETGSDRHYRKSMVMRAFKTTSNFVVTRL